MKYFSRLILLLMISTVLITSCKKSVPKQINYIPKDAVFIATINTKSLQIKLLKNQETIENIVKSLSGNDTSVNKGKQEWEDLKSSGVDLDENFYVSVVQKGGGMSTGKGTAVISAIGSLKDADKLQAYIKKKEPAAEVRKEKDYSYTTFGGDRIVGWGKDVVIMMTYQKAYSGGMEYDSATGSYNLQRPVSVENEMKAEIENDFNLKEDQSVASIPEFRDLMQEKSDASMWINSSSSIESLPLPLPKLKELLSNSFTAAKVDFEDGKINFMAKSYYSKDLREILKKYSGATADLGLIENYPSNNINGFGVFSFNPQLFVEVVKYLEVGGMADAYLTKMMGSNYTLQEALKAIKGDFAAVVSDFSMRPVTDSTNSVRMGNMPNLKWIVNIPVGDKVQMDRLMDKLVQNQMLVKTGNEYRLAPQLQRVGVQVEVNDKNLYIAADENILTQYKAKSQKAGIDKDVMSDFKGKPGVAYINIESILNAIPAQNNAQVNNIMPKAKETFKDIKIYSEDFNGKYIESHAEFRFKNEKENSLTSLLSFIETASKNFKNASAAPMDTDGDVQADTSAMRMPGKGR